MLPYRHWLKALKAAFPKETNLLNPSAVRFDFTPAPGTPAELAALLYAVSDRPADQAPRLILADWLEECGDGRARETRNPVVSEDQVVRRVFGKGAHVVHVGNGHGETKQRIQSRHYGDLGRRDMITEHIAGRPLFIVPEIRDAVHVEQSREVLAMFGDVGREIGL
jgi:uncharacterized protein (TIGR02996 family)